MGCEAGDSLKVHLFETCCYPLDMLPWGSRRFLPDLNNAAMGLSTSRRLQTRQLALIREPIRREPGKIGFGRPLAVIMRRHEIFARLDFLGGPPEVGGSQSCFCGPMSHLPLAASSHSCDTPRLKQSQSFGNSENTEG